MCKAGRDTLRSWCPVFLALIVLLFSVGTPGAAVSPSATLSPLALPVAEPAVDPLQSRKLEAEIEKLESEIAILRAVDARSRLLTTWLAAIGSIIGAIVGGVFTFFVTRMGSRFNQMQKDLEHGRAKRDEVRRKQDEKLSRLKLTQEREHARELHDLRLFQDLGHSSHRARLAAAAVLLDRLQRLRQPCDPADRTPLEATEGELIAKVLVAVLKRGQPRITQPAGENDEGEGTDDRAGDASAAGEAALRKYIADELVDTLEARFERGAAPREFGRSPLGEGPEFQKCDLADVYWAFVDARSLDFFGSDFTRASLRSAALQQAVFYEATMVETVLRDADLRRANLMGADLRRADLRDADLREANLQGANLGGADLRGARLEGAVINLEAFQRFRATRWPEGFLGATESGAEVMADTYRPAS